MTNTVNASPTKRFFVEMLTRDIELDDAILDVLDNCVDGIMRTLQNKLEGERPYQPFWASISATPKGFSIEDNCGGIPEETALKYAFRFGREHDRDEGLKTIGMYGIGMKRAIFKMGRKATVTSQHQGKAYKVEIPEEWFGNDSWELELEPLEDNFLGRDGTLIEVENLVDGVKSQFDPDDDFLAGLRKDISVLFAMIMKKGFQVKLNGQAIEADEIRLVSPGDFDSQLVEPFRFKGKLDGVSVEMAVGFFRKLGKLEETEQESERPQEPQRNHPAGWTVICNDRVVLYGDRSMKTGWGRNQVPAYHPQFRSIAGVVTFEADDAIKLPLNTTKRGLDSSNLVFLSVLDYMQKGTKLFTDFTNWWKTQESEANKLIVGDSLSVDEVVAQVPNGKWSKVHKIERRNSGDEARQYIPDLPRPPDTRKRRRVAFDRPLEEIQKLSEFFFGEAGRTPSEVGERAFGFSLRAAEEDGN